MKADAGSDARTLQRLVSGGPTVSIYFNLAASPDGEDAGRRLAALLDGLDREGIGLAAREALAERVHGSPRGAGTLAVFVAEADERTPTVVEMPGARLPDLVKRGPLPYIRPLTGAGARILPPGTPNAPAEGIGALCCFGG